LTRIGLLSDSHGRARTTQRAVDLLVEQRVQCLIHLGDIGGVDVIDALLVAPPGSDQPLPCHLVFGNVDWDASSLAQYARRLGLTPHDPHGALEVDGKRLAFHHGHDGSLMQHLIREQYDFVCHGHSHVPVDDRRGPTRIVNPGALFRAKRYTVAVLDLADDTVAFHDLDRDAG